MATATADSIKFVELMNEKFKDASVVSAKNFSVDPGRKYDKIVQRRDSRDGSVHCFIDRTTGQVFKAAGWAKPAQGVRYNTVDEAAAAADLYGAYLYAN